MIEKRAARLPLIDSLGSKLCHVTPWGDMIPFYGTSPPFSEFALNNPVFK